MKMWCIEKWDIAPNIRDGKTWYFLVKYVFILYDILYDIIELFPIFHECRHDYSK